MHPRHLWLIILILLPGWSFTQSIKDYNISWENQSNNAAESMPLGGGDIGMNVWVENDEVLFYFSRSGTFDENNALLKLGRIRLRISPNPFENGDFKQTLDLQSGSISIAAKNKRLSAQLTLWVEVYEPVIHADLTTSAPTHLTASYENWRYQDRATLGRANNANSYKWTGKNVTTKKDCITFENDGVLFYHQNSDTTMFDITVNQQGLNPVKEHLKNPLNNLTFGGKMSGENMKSDAVHSGKYLDTDYQGWNLVSKDASKVHTLQITLHTEQTPDVPVWKAGLEKTIKSSTHASKTKTQKWWQAYWERSFIYIHRSTQDSIWQTARNYQLFRYMLGCNAYGSSPTKFNGGLFTYDPVQVDSLYPYTPDHRNWGGGTHTAQNQRLVYFPMLKSGDFDLMIPQFEFYLNALNNAEWRSQQYWGHQGASFTEQLENFGLPNYAEYGSKRPVGYDPGMQYNAWLEYQWDTVLEFCFMILETETYAGKDISRYLPLIESTLTFFNEHYPYLAKERGRKAFDQNDNLILYPGSSCETYKMAYNSSSTVAALQVVLKRLLQSSYLPEGHQTKWENMLNRIPPISFQEFEGKTTIAPAKLWERINNTEAPQLYPVFPWGIYGIGKPDLDIAVNTYNLDPDVQQFKSHVGWKQYNIWAARLGLTEEAAKYTTLKLKDSERRFPAFWGPGFDWVPDLNWAGSGAIGLQEMLLQTHGDSILLFPAWPKAWDVHFKLYAPGNTSIEVELKHGHITQLIVTPKERRKDLINLLPTNP